jgi:nicotinamide-nucleotide amidase
MHAEVLVIGSELLLGQIVDTNSAFIARQLASIGLDLYYKTTVGDNLGRLSQVLGHALDRSQVIITTGGIGPTADDVTREAVAVATGRELTFSPLLMEQISNFFRSRGMTPSSSNRRQAFIPDGAIPIENPVGTAPGFIVEVGEKSVITLPGVPREMEHLLTNRVLPYLRSRYDLTGQVKLRVLRMCGLGESRIGEILHDFMEKGRNPTVGTMAHLGQVDVRIAAKGKDEAEALSLIEPVEAEIRRRAGDLIFGVDGETLEGVISARLRTLGWKVSVVDQGTGGLVAMRLTDGAPKEFGGAVVFGESVGPHSLGISLSRSQTGEEKARALAHGVLKFGESQMGLAILVEKTSPEDQHAYQALIACAIESEVFSREYKLGGDLNIVRIRAATLALDLLRKTIK